MEGLGNSISLKNILCHLLSKIFIVDPTLHLRYFVSGLTFGPLNEDLTLQALVIIKHYTSRDNKMSNTILCFGSGEK